MPSLIRHSLQLVVEKKTEVSFKKNQKPGNRSLAICWVYNLKAVWKK